MTMMLGFCGGSRAKAALGVRRAVRRVAVRSFRMGCSG
jgi:hypothetical protein